MFLENFQGSGISAWDFWGFIFGRGIFWVLLEALQGMVWVLIFLPICSSPSLGIRSTPPPRTFRLSFATTSQKRTPMTTCRFSMDSIVILGFVPQKKEKKGIELFSLYFHFRQTTWWYPRELFLSIVVLLMHVHPHAYVCIINEKTKGKFPGEHHVGNQNIQENLRGMGSAPHFPTPTAVPTGAPTVFFALSLQIENQDVGLRTVHLFCVKAHLLFYLFLRL